MPEKMKKALGGVKVIEFAQFVAGPYCGKLLADNGAEVIKVEPPGQGDQSRSRGRFPDDMPDRERSALFIYLNTNKMGVTLSPATEEGRKVFLQLVEQADILVEDNPPHLMKELGLDYESLKKVNPGLIMTSITPFGQTGPYRDYKSYYLTNFHASGFGYLTPPDPGNPAVLKREPIMMGGFLAEYYAGVNATIPTLAALYVGVGQQIDVSVQETQFISQKTDISTHFVDGEVLNRASITGSTTWGGVLPGEDGFVNVGAPKPEQIAAFFDLMGNPEWTKEDRFKPENVHLHTAEMAPMVREWVAQHGREEIWHGGQKRGIPLAAVYRVGELLDNDHMKARESFLEVEQPQAGRMASPAEPYRFSATPVRIERPAPLLGEHNVDVYCGRLGYSKSELAKLRRAHIV